MTINTYTIDEHTKEVRILCSFCKKEVTLKYFRKIFLYKKYLCQSCCIKGNKNPFYGKHHTEKSKKKMGANVHDYKGINNPFFGKSHTEKVIQNLKNNERCKHIGNKNPFYGKHHSKETIEKIKKANKDFRIKNQDKVIQNGLNRINKTKEELENVLQEYLVGGINRDLLMDKYKIDYRTLKYWWVKLGLVSKEDLDVICAYKKLYSNPSAPELRLYNLLAEKYGNENVKSNYPLFGYYYDICLFGKILIEYDGYYWHKVIKNKNDEIKNRIAAENGYVLYRVEEAENRIINLEKDISAIGEMINQL